MKFKLMVLTIFVLILTHCSYEPQKKISETPPEILITNSKGQGISLELEFIKGKQHNYPLMAVWIEDLEGNYIQTLYVAQSIAKGFFKHGDKSSGKWLPGPIRRPAALPYWAHKRGIMEEDGLYMPTQNTPIPDAYTGATPTSNFVLKTKTDKEPINPFKVLFEINQSWDWNRYWHNNKYPYDNDYKSSAQPALVYEFIVDVSAPKKEYEAILIGHSHYAGKDGTLFTDLSTITSAKDITKKLILRIQNTK